MASRRPLPQITINNQQFIPIARGAKDLGVSLNSMAKYVSVGMVQQVHKNGYRYVSKSDIMGLKAKPPPSWGNAEWISKEGRKYYPTTRAADTIGVSRTTFWSWVEAGKTSFNFHLDVVKLGIAKKRNFIAEDSLLALADLMRHANTRPARGQRAAIKTRPQNSDIDKRTFRSLRSKR